MKKIRVNPVKEARKAAIKTEVARRRELAIRFGNTGNSSDTKRWLLFLLMQHWTTHEGTNFTLRGYYMQHKKKAYAHLMKQIRLYYHGYSFRHCSAVNRKYWNMDDLKPIQFTW